ncbi:MAG TPA: hypothetical protein VFI68_03715 [Anaerolineales bacterium]|nr:hypothetical protein [Anaerolineales bacterium]
MTIVYILGAILVGWFIGFIDSNIRTAKKIKAAEANAEIMIKEAERKIALAAQAPQTVQDNPGLLRLKNENGHYVLELDGAPVERALSPEKKKRLIELITIFRPWLDGGQPSQAVTKPAVPAQTQPVITAVQEPISRPIQPVSLSSKKPEADKNLASLSIVQQIDSVLQTRILDTPMAKQGVRLQESLQGDVEVYVGLHKFHAVEDVPDEVIKTTIREAIAEWEAKYTRGP